MEEKKSQSLYDRVKRKKRIKHLKKAIISFVVLWMFICMLLSIVLMVKVFSLQKQIDVLMESMIRNQQISRKEEVVDSDKNLVKQAEISGDSGTAEKNEKFSFIEDIADDEDVRKVYLTFDDGPSANTEQILNILDQYQLKATFFVVGKDDAALDVWYKEIVDRGHTIGMHSFSHRYDVIYKSLNAFSKDLKLIESKIYDVTGVKCKLYRFPGGSSNQVSNLPMTEFIRYLNEQGITYFDWNVECGDATSNDYSVDELVDNVMTDIVKHSTCVVLMHDSNDKPKTVEALPKMIEQILALDDTQILPIEENTTLIQHVSAETVED